MPELTPSQKETLRDALPILQGLLASGHYTFCDNSTDKKKHSGPGIYRDYFDEDILPNLDYSERAIEDALFTLKNLKFWIKHEDELQ